MSKDALGALSATVGIVVGVVLGWLVCHQSAVRQPTGIMIGQRSGCSLQDVDASVLATLAQAGCVVEQHEFSATTGGKVVGRTPGGKPIKFAYVPRNDALGPVVISASVSNISTGEHGDDAVSYQSFLTGLLESICFTPKCSN